MTDNYLSVLFDLCEDKVFVAMSLLERKRGSGGKFKKNSKRTLQLSNEDLEYLKKNTALEEKDIQEWFR